MKKFIAFIILFFAIGTVSAQSSQQKAKSKTPARNSTSTQKKGRPAQGTASKTVAKKSAVNFCPDNKHPHAIDLGLPSETLWACCNVGATIPEELGGLYAVGELKEKKVFMATNHKYHSGSSGNNFDMRNFITGTEKDVAHVKWGNSWSLPVSEQLIELKNNCMFEFTTVGGVAGAKIIGPNGNIIFLPAAGIGFSEGRNSSGKEGNYSSGDSGSAVAWQGYWSRLYFDDSGMRFDNSYVFLYFGYSIRPVKDER